ncbi:MAG: thioredoxin family protein [Flavobacteriaceae bacterium]|nr:thioredoxin family protein [Flavobacteriaceae bacterium]
MNTETQTQLTRLIQESLANAITYEAYRKLIDDLLTEEKSTGDTQSESLLNYSQLNVRRMSRWDKTLRVPQEIENRVKKFQGKQTWLVINEGWCGDSAHSVPVMHKLASLNENIKFRVVLRDENDALMNQFLTNGGKSIPKLIVLDTETFEVINEWGPRPTEATRLVEAYKAEHGSLDAAFKEDLQLWYNKDKGLSTMEDLVKLLDS